tara:strand:+ start:62 stop:373 length:312 start_codon:yes stop_codon:yes gene_type:complete
MLSIIASTVFSGSAVCISKVAPEMQLGAKHAPTRAALSYDLPGNLNALDLSGSGLNWDPARGLLKAQESSEVVSNYCGCGGEGCPFCRGPAAVFEEFNKAVAM